MLLRDPAALDARCAQGHQLLSAGREAEAEAVFRAVLALEGGNILALEGIGLIADRRGDLPAAKEAFTQVLALKPMRLEAQVKLAEILDKLGETQRSAELLDAALDREPAHAGALFLRADQLTDEGLHAEVHRRFRAAVTRDHVLDRLVEAWISGKWENSDWRGYDEGLAYLGKTLRAGRDVGEPMTLMRVSENPAELLLAAQRYAARRIPAFAPLWQGGRRREGRIRLAYFSTDFRDHAVAHIFAGLIENHDRERFEITAYSFGEPSDHPIRRRIETAFEHFLDVRAWSDEQIARDARARDIDIAVSLNGYTRGARPEIFARRCAPVQVNYMGFPGTMGARWMDYLIADPHAVPPRAERFYSESVARLPETYQAPGSPNLPSVPEVTRAGEGLPDGAFVFTNMNQTVKITPAVFGTWLRILEQVDNSVLWLGRSSNLAMKHLRGYAAEAGVDPDRLVFCAHVKDRDHHLARFAHADLFLDTLPYNAHSVATEALAGGVPIVTCRGETFPGRVCAGLLTVAGLPDLVTDNLADYEALAVAIARDPGRLAALRARVRDARQGPLFDPVRYARHLEAAFEAMHARAVAGQKPASFDAPLRSD